MAGNYEEMIPMADLVINLTPDKNHTSVVNKVIPLMVASLFFPFSWF